MAAVGSSEASAWHCAHVVVGSLWEPQGQETQHGPRLGHFLLGEFGKPEFPLKVGLTLPPSLRSHWLVLVRRSTRLIMTVPVGVTATTTLPTVSEEESEEGKSFAEGHREYDG